MSDRVPSCAPRRRSCGRLRDNLTRGRNQPPSKRFLTGYGSGMLHSWRPDRPAKRGGRTQACRSCCRTRRRSTKASATLVEKIQQLVVEFPAWRGRKPSAYLLPLGTILMRKAV